MQVGRGACINKAGRAPATQVRMRKNVSLGWMELVASSEFGPLEVLWALPGNPKSPRPGPGTCTARMAPRTGPLPSGEGLSSVPGAECSFYFSHMGLLA